MAVHTFCLDANGNHKEVSDAATKGSTYGMATDGKNLYVATCSEGILVNRYDGKAWHCSKMKDGTISDVVPVCRQGTLFVLTSGAYTGTTNLYRYDVANDQFAQEGVSLDSYSTSQTICAADGTLYVSYLPYILAEQNGIQVPHLCTVYFTDGYLPVALTDVE